MINVEEQKQELLKLLQILNHIESTEILADVIDSNELKKKREHYEWIYKQQVYKLGLKIMNKGNAREYTPTNQN